MITVEAITFNHDPGASTHGALNIRRNASQTVHVPEWRRFISVNPEDSPAVYAVTATKGNQVTIMVSLRSTDPGLTFVECELSIMSRRGRSILSTARPEQWRSS